MKTETKTYQIAEVAHLTYEIVLHMRRCGSVTAAVWYEYLETPNAQRYCAIVAANPRLAPLF
jgi:hypothetical protein